VVEGESKSNYLQMVRSIRPQDFDDRKEPGRRLTNMEIGMLMLTKLAESIERYKPKGARNQTEIAERVEELLRVAKHRARATGQTIGQVLRDHRDALEDQGGKNKFVLTTSDSKKAETENAKMHVAMALQDERRATQQVHPMIKATGRIVDAEVARLDRNKEIAFDPYLALPPPPGLDRDELQPPSHVGTNTSVTRRAAPAHKLTLQEGTSNPNADHLRLMAPPTSKKKQKGLYLLDNPEGGGGMHNPHQL